MRFCLVSTQQRWGGGEALLWSIGSELRQSGHSVSWIVRGAGEVERRIESGGERVLHSLKKRGSNFGDWLATVRALRSWVPDVVVLNDSHAVPLVGSAALFCRGPRPLRLAYKHTVFPLRSSLKYRLLTDKLVCVSQAARDVVIKGGLAKEHAVVIHGGCDPLKPDCCARQSVRRELGLHADQTLLVSVGNLLACKGHRELIAAMKILLSEHPGLVAVIAGEGEERPRLERQIQDLQLGHQVRLLGYRTDAQRLLSAADLVVHPSHAEGLSLVLIQAQMLGRPIVATAVGGTCEVLAIDSSDCSSWIAAAGDPQSLAERIDAALSGIEHNPPVLLQKLQASAARMRSAFSVQSTAVQFSSLASSLLAR